MAQRQEKQNHLQWRKRKCCGRKGYQARALVDSILVMNGIYFASRSGKEHRQLRSDPCQITLYERPGARPYLEYVEDTSKNRSGGLKG